MVISYISRVIADYVPNFVAMATGVLPGVIRMTTSVAMEIFTYNRVFRGRAIEWRQKKKLSRPTPVTMATKFETKSAITRLIEEITPRSLRITGGFRRPAIAWRQTNFTTTNPYCHGNEIWEKIGYNSACTLYKRYLWNVCVRQGVFGVGLSNDAKQILQWPTLVAMATKIETTQAIPPVVSKISQCRIRLVGGIRGWAIELCQTNSTTTNPVATAMNLWQNRL